MLNSRLITLAAVLGASSLTGCASIVSGSNQVVSVDARHKGQTLVGANCQLSNGKGTFYVTTPGTVTVHRAYDDMNVKCEKDGLLPGITSVKSSTKPMAFGNILFGGVIGAAVDAGTGSAFDYPPVITVLMDEVNNLLTPNTAAAPKAAVGSPAPTGQP